MGAIPTTQHLVLADWHRWGGLHAHDWPLAERRRHLLARWPVIEVDRLGLSAGTRLPALSTTPMLRSHDEAIGSAQARARWDGVLLRPVHAAAGTAPTLWHRPAPACEVHALLQYVPAEALSADGAQALCALPCGLAVWNRAPRSQAECARALAQVLRAATEAGWAPPADDDLHLLPLARVPLALTSGQAARLHAWLRDHAGPRFGTMGMVLPGQVFLVRCGGWLASRRHRVGVLLQDVQPALWAEELPAHRADDASRFGLE